MAGVSGLKEAICCLCSFVRLAENFLRVVVSRRRALRKLVDSNVLRAPSFRFLQKAQHSRLIRSRPRHSTSSFQDGCPPSS